MTTFWPDPVLVWAMTFRAEMVLVDASTLRVAGPGAPRRRAPSALEMLTTGIVTSLS